MTNEPFRLVFKRGQSRGKKLTFSLQVSAEMSPDFEQAAHEYGYWNEMIYADPTLEEARELKLQKSVARTERKRRRGLDLMSGLDGGFIMVVLFPIWFTWKIIKLVYVVPIKLIWWLFRASRTQKKQIMRFSELKTGKTITTHSLPDIVEAEEVIKQTTGSIETHILAALNYGGEAFDATPTT